MTFGAVVGILLTLGIVLSLLAVSMRLLRRVTFGAGAAARGGLKLEVVQRLPLGPRQGIAVVRIGTQTIAVSVGEGGVRPLLELDAEDLAAAAPAPAERALPALPAGRDFATALRQGLRQAGLPFVALAAMLIGASSPAAAQANAQANAQAPATTSAPAAIAATRPQASAPAPSTAAAPQAPSAAATADALLNRAAPQLDLRLNGGKEDGLQLSGTVGVVVMLGLLTLLPTLLLMMTGFTRILIVLHFLRQALGTQSSPPAHLVSALSLLLTGFVMAPTLAEVNRVALTPWMNGEIQQVEMMKAAIEPFRGFMLRQTRDKDLAAFVEMSQAEPPASREEVSTVVLMSAFVTSELRTAFQLGFALFLPFIVIDIVVSSVLMSMGMFMLPPAMISLPFKLLLFVLVDGWTLIVQSLVAGFR